jgi:hypothetical protein
MVKYVPDRTGRFSQRPHYEPKELDRECENIIAGFLKERHGAAKYPVSTDTGPIFGSMQASIVFEKDDSTILNYTRRSSPSTSWRTRSKIAADVVPSSSIPSAVPGRP